MRINYLLQDTALFGGVKIALHQARLLHRRGHEVRIVSPGTAPGWFGSEVPFERVRALDSESLPAADVHVATFWTTIGAAAEARVGQGVHYCQGFEASYTHNQEEHPQILEAYGARIPGLALSPHLGELLRSRFGRPARVVPPALESWWRPRVRFGPRRVARVAVVHPFENDWKGVATALRAVGIMRASGSSVQLVRVSQWPLGDAEQGLLTPDEYHCHLRPEQVARLLSACDLLLAPSWEQEGFGLPVLEAMACGVPVVGSDISAFRGYASGAAALVEAHDPEAFATAAAEILADRRRWRAMRRSGLEVARRFTEKATAEAAEAAMEWVASGGWRDELD